MTPTIRNLLLSLLLALVWIEAAQAEDEFFRLNEAIPSDHDALRIAPVFDFNPDGCEPSAPIRGDGRKNSGLNTSGTLEGMCHDKFLEISNTYHRYACLTEQGTEYCVDFYALYFQKDQAAAGAVDYIGHRHDWEHVGVWTTDGEITHVCASAHGHCEPKEAGDSDVIFIDESHVAIVYFKDGGGTHALELANPSDPVLVFRPLNDEGVWATPTLVSWYELKGLVEVLGDGVGNDDGICNESFDHGVLLGDEEYCEEGLDNEEMRYVLNTYDYGTASLPVRDGAFFDHINTSIPEGYPTWTRASVEASNPNPEPGIEELEERIGRIENGLEELEERIEDHTHIYLTGRGSGHNNVEAETGFALSPDGVGSRSRTFEAEATASKKKNKKKRGR